jgi:type IV secretory pathway TraG/TraD family ATPase VirD4
MDNDLCIIFEKGVKPIQARKFYYFKTPMARKLAAYEISHNDIPETDRGVWRKYNPYNPYVEEDKQKKVEDLKIESLDDLFDEPVEDKKDEVKEIKIESELKQNDAPVLPQEYEDDGMDEDLQKELESKFDELFGPLED